MKLIETYEVKRNKNEHPLTQHFKAISKKATKDEHRDKVMYGNGVIMGMNVAFQKYGQKMDTEASHAVFEEIMGYIYE